MGYRVTAYPLDQNGEEAEAIETDTEKLSFVNDESYGPPSNFGISTKGTYTLVNLSQVAVVEVEVT